MNTRQRVAVVTGAGQGIGRATARLLAGDGFSVVLVDRDARRVDDAAGEIGGRGVVLDIADRAAVDEFATSITELDVLVNNAGIWRFGPLLDVPAADITAVLEVNLLGTLWMTRALAGALAVRRGAVVNLSSVAAKNRTTGVGSYPVSKAAIEAMTQQLARELGGRGVRVNCVGPGLVVSEGTAASYAGEAADRRAQAVPIGRLGTPADIAAVIAWLCSPGAAYVSGQIIYVDGGLSASVPSA